MSGEAGDDMRGHVFLCHSSSDKKQVKQLYTRLTNDGFDCWIDDQDLLPGHDWDLEIRRALRRSQAILVCVSRRSYDRAGYLQKELRRALSIAEEQPDGSVFIIPVRLELCDLPEKLAQWQSADFFDEGGYQRLVAVLRAAKVGDGAHTGKASSAQLAIDDVIVTEMSDHVQLDVRIRNLSPRVLNLTRARVRVIERMAAASMYAPSAGYDLTIDGELNEVSIGHRLEPEEVDGFYLRLGFPPYNTSCHFVASLSILLNGRWTAESERFQFGSFFESKRTPWNW